MVSLEFEDGLKEAVEDGLEYSLEVLWRLSLRKYEYGLEEGWRRSWRWLEIVYGFGDLTIKMVMKMVI